MSEDDGLKNSDRRLTIQLGKAVDGRTNVWNQPIPYEDLPDEVKRYLLDKKSRPEPKNTLEKLEGKHVMSMILFIDSMSPVVKSDIYNSISRSANVVSKLDGLRDMGLIEMYHTGRTNMSVIVITEKGRKIASVIRQMIDTIDS
ncbi:hypothetical protein PED39_06195 [Methanomassiliicoccales archaeon LGM-RCC1]|nr:hypothetical protein PED39_06195 [Methanomassiliicoccales archaeon LGM-RCC1]